MDIKSLQIQFGLMFALNLFFSQNQRLQRSLLFAQPLPCLLPVKDCCANIFSFYVFFPTHVLGNNKTVSGSSRNPHSILDISLSATQNLNIAPKEWILLFLIRVLKFFLRIFFSNIQIVFRKMYLN